MCSAQRPVRTDHLHSDCLHSPTVSPNRRVCAQMLQMRSAFWISQISAMPCSVWEEPGLRAAPADMHLHRCVLLLHEQRHMIVLRLLCEPSAYWMAPTPG